MTQQTQLKRVVRSLQPGDVVFISTNANIQNKELHVDRIESSERHAKDGQQHYRVYLNGIGNSKGIGKYVINLHEVNWALRRKNHPAPELFYIDDEGTPAGKDERTEGSITSLQF